MDKTDRILKSLQPRAEIKTPIATDMFIPNLSGDGSHLQKVNADNGVPIGSIQMYGGSTAPTGWFLCNGTWKSKIVYATLYAVIGDTFNNGIWSDSTFKVPDFGGIFPRGAGTQSGDNLKNANGTAFAGVLGTYQNDKMQGHYHSPLSPATNFADVHTAAVGTNYGNVATYSYSTATTGSPTTDTTNGTPRKGAETNPANLGVNFIIKY